MPARARSAPPVVAVVGAGAGGATLAALLAGLFPGRLRVILVEPSGVYITPFFSERFFGGLWPLERLTHRPLAALAGLGVEIVRDRAVAIDRDRKTLRLGGGGDVRYDVLAAAPGVSFRTASLPGYDAAAMPHGWLADGGIADLQRRLEAVEDGAVIVIAPPAGEHRCPPAPYARATMIAHALKPRKPRAKVLILDAKNDFVMQPLFEAVWADNYAGMIEWIPADFHGGVQSLDAGAGILRTDPEIFRADVANIIPPQAAAPLLLEAGLADETGYCPTGPWMQSARDPDIYIIGDSAAAGMSKSASSAQAQAQLAALDISRRLLRSGQEDATDPDALETVCWMLLHPADAVYLRTDYGVSGAGRVTERAVFQSAVEDSRETRALAAEASLEWYEMALARMVPPV